jgi:preprotein translocase subunit SecD
MVIASALSIGLRDYPYGRDGVEIVYISDLSPAKDILSTGMIITQFNGKGVTSVIEWIEAVESAGSSGTVSLIANNQQYEIELNATGAIGIDVMEMDTLNLEFGLDLRGGTRIILMPKEANATEEDITQTISTLQTRSNLYGLQEINFYSIKGIDGNYFIQIEAAGVRKDIVDDLLSRQGKFEAKVSKPVALENNAGIMQIGVSNYPVTLLADDSILIDNQTVQPDGEFRLSGMEFQYLNTSQGSQGNKLHFMVDVYGDNDIELVYSDPQHSGIVPQNNGFQFYFVVLVSTEGAQRFADVTTGIPSHLDINTGERYLDSSIFLYLDDNLVSELQISSSLGGNVYQSPQIQGFRTEREEAAQEKLSLQTILRSGALPVALEAVSIDIISPTLGTGFFASAGYAALMGAIVVFVIVFIRYRKIRISIPMILIAFSEVLIILGIAATGDSMIWGVALVLNFILISTAWWKEGDIDIFAWTGALLIPIIGMMSWTIDLPAIAGIIAVIGTGVDHQIIIADETLSRKEERVYDIKEKIKRAFFIIFGAAATTIVAMIPLMSVGIGLVRGFAITTIIGVLVGVLITRPAYARVVEALLKKD